MWFRPRLVTCLKEYSRATGREDVLAGLTVGIVSLPLAMAFAMASGVSPQAGIVTAVIAGFLAAVFGGSRLSVTGPTGAFIVVVYGVVAKYGIANLLVCTFMSGVMLLLMGMFRMGQIIRFFPLPLVTGFTNGIAVLIFLTQLKDFFGLPINKMPSGFFAIIQTLRLQIAHFHLPTLLLSASALLLILLWPKQWNRLAPAPFVALILATVLTTLFGFPVATLGSKFGGIPQGFPALGGLDLDPEHLSDLLAPAFTLALLGAIESLLCAVVADRLTNDKHDSNQELMGQGIANMVAPFFGGIPATGAIARTATNISNGGKTPVSAIIHAIFLLFVLLVAAPLASYIPLAVLAAILISVSLKMGDWDIRKALLYPKRDTAILVTTLVLTVAFDLTIAVQIGLLMAAVFFIRNMASSTHINHLTMDMAPQLERHSMLGKTLPDGCAVFRLDGALFFGATEILEQILQYAPYERVIILQLHRLVLLDTTGLLALENLQRKLLKQQKTLIVCGTPDIIAPMIKHSHLGGILGSTHLQPDLTQALLEAERILTEGVVWG